MTFLASGQGAGGCGACTDIPLLAATTARVESFRFQAKDTAASFLPFWCAPGILLAAPGVAFSPKRTDHTVHFDGTLSHLRTVVLRC